MSNYRKLIAAIVGVLAMLANQKFGLDLTGMEVEVTNGIIALLTAVGVWALPNTPSSRTTFNCAPVAVVLAVGLMLAACAGTLQTRATNALAVACDTYATALAQLAPLRAADALTADQVTRVDATNAAVDPLCSSGSAIDPSAAVGTVQSAIITLEGITR